MPGSPPRAWGARHEDRHLCRARRITPTCVGSTRSGCRAPRRVRDHPHVRGERSSGYARKIIRDGSLPRAWGAHRQRGGRRLEGGSPPRAWGAPLRRPVAGRQRRIAPTCVGSTARTAARSRTSRDHPHVRGEHSDDTDRMTRRGGSPPRAWGAPEWQRRRRWSAGITPTCVGSTMNS